MKTKASKQLEQAEKDYKAWEARFNAFWGPHEKAGRKTWVEVSEFENERMNKAKASK
jgi:hypothetical protein